MTQTLVSLFCIGFFLGFFVSVPVGPISLVVIKRTLSSGTTRAGRISGAGAATADLIYAILAVLSVTAIHAFLLKKMVLLETVGAIALISFGLHTFGKEPQGDEEDVPTHHMYFSSLLLTLANPMTLVAFFAIFAGLHLSERTLINDLFLSLGIFAGSFVWWAVLSHIAHRTRHQFDHRKLHRFNQIAGIVIAVCGFIALSRLM